jgi:hypothetical protein
MNILKFALAFALAATTALAQATPPQGRLTLISGTPVMTSDIVNASTLYYAPYVGNSIPIYNGTSMQSNTFSHPAIVIRSAERRWSPQWEFRCKSLTSRARR